MPLQERTIYPSFSTHYSDQDLQALFVPQPHEREWASQQARNVRTQELLLLLLKTHQCLGYFPKLGRIPREVRKSISLQFALDDLAGFSERYIRKAQTVVRHYLKLQRYSEGGEECLRKLLEELCHRMADPADLVNAAISELLRLRYSLPSYSRLKRLVRNIRHRVHLELYDEVNRRLGLSHKRALDSLLEVPDGAQKSPFTQLKQYPGPARISFIRQWVKRWKWLDGLIDTDSLLADFTFTKLSDFAAQAQASESADMLKTAHEGRKHLLLLALIHHKKRETKDELTHMLIRRVRRAHTKAKEELERLHSQQRELKEQMLEVLEEIVQKAKEEPEAEPLGLSVQELIRKKGGVEYLEGCSQLLAGAKGNNHLPFLWKYHLSQRKVLLDIVELLEVQSATQNNLLMKCWELYLPFRHSHRETLNEVDFPLGFASQRWIQAILNVKNGKTVYNRQMLELCLFHYLSEGLQSTDLFVNDSFDFADYRAYMLPMEDVRRLLSTFCQQAELHDTPQSFVQKLQNELREAIRTFDQHFGTNSSLSIDEHGKLRVRRKKRGVATGIVKAFREKVQARMTPSSLLDILSAGNHWTQFSRNFYPITGNEPKSAQTKLHHLYTLFAYGSHLGPVQTAKHTSQPISSRVMSKINQLHIDAKKLQAGIVDTVNHYQSFELSGHWGDASTAVADGTHVELAENNLMGERHIRYGGYGGIAYHHISDTYVALFSHFIACGTWEAVYILDGLMQNKSALRPHRVHADTQGQNEPAFGLAYLLGIELMPRIRNFRDMTLYRVDNLEEYQHVQELFTQPINWELIERHWEDLMQVAVSIQQGKILPSMILQKLGIHGRKTTLYKAFRELGRVRRTLFLIQYMQDQEFQHSINQSTNKIESFNNFCDWITFGGEYMMTGDPIEHEKRVKYTSLIANNLMLYNTQELTRIIRELREEGSEVTTEMLAGLSPYMTEHIRRFGEFVLNQDIDPAPIEFSLGKTG